MSNRCPYLFVSFLSCFTVVILLGCEDERSYEAQPQYDVGNIESTRDPLVINQTTLYFEGTCDFLDNCSSYDNLTCGAPYTCTDTTNWIARKNTGYNICNETVYICRKDNPYHCTTAKVWDTSSGNMWEGNKSLFEALGFEYNCTWYYERMCSMDDCSYSFGQLEISFVDRCAYYCRKYGTRPSGCPPCAV
jgi:hypothetical protein